MCRSGTGRSTHPHRLGTDSASKKDIVTAGGKKYVLELPLKADVAIIRGSIVDTFGNIIYNKTTRNFNPLMAMAAETVIVEAEKIVEAGELEPDYIMTPGIFVDYIVRGVN